MAPTPADQEVNYVPFKKYKGCFIRRLPIPPGASSFVVNCRFCPGKYKTSHGSTGNLLKHLRCAHPLKLHEVEAAATASKEKTPQRPAASREKEPHDIRALLQPGRACSLSQEEFDDHLLDVIIESKLPFQILERPRFKKFLKRLAPGRTVFCRKTAGVRVASRYKRSKDALKAEFARVQCVGTTADAWKCRGKAYVGVTAHWIDPSTMARKSAALACRRVKGSQTYDVIATLLCAIFEEFEIQHKISSCVTDNGSNFCKAFRVFTDEDEDDDEDNDSTEDDDEVQPMDLDEMLHDGERQGDLRLPAHRRCASHTLNLVATKDIEDCLTRPGALSSVWDPVMTKCRAFWSKQKRSTFAQDTVKKDLGKVLPVPNATRWNSMFDAMKEVAWHYEECRRGAIRTVCEKLKVEALTVREVECVREYVRVMEPLACTLDLLQGEKHVSIGYLLPAIHNLLAKYRGMSGLKHCQPLVAALIDSIKRRFKDQLWNRELVVAACLVPMFRLDWIPSTVEGNNKVHEAREWLEEALADSVAVANPTEGEGEGEGEADDPEGPERMDTGNNAVRQLFSFLATPRQARQEPQEELDKFLTEQFVGEDVLKKCKYIKDLYIKFNSCLPSSASAERLFSHAGLVLNPRRSCLGDQVFDSLVFLGVNKELLSL